MDKFDTYLVLLPQESPNLLDPTIRGAKPPTSKTGSVRGASGRNSRARE